MTTEQLLQQSLDIRNAMCRALGMRVTDCMDADPVEWCRIIREDLDQLRAEVQRLQAIIVGLTDRIAAQSELLAKRSERKPA